MAQAVELNFEEILTARGYFTKHAEDKITNIHQLRSILGDLGQHPSQAEMELVMNVFEDKVSFEDFSRYLTWLKRLFMKPEARDADTVRAFVALGGKADRGGDINADDLRSACRRFQLTIDIDAMLREVDEDNSGSIEYGEFRSMWDDGTGGGSGVQFQIEEEAQNDGEVLAALREYLAAKAKEQNQGNRPANIKRKQSSKTLDAGRKGTLRMQPVASSSPSKTAKPEESNKIQAEEVGSEDDVEPVKQEVKERQNPNANDPVYRRYLMTDPIVVGQKKTKPRRAPPVVLPPLNTPRTRSQVTPRKPGDSVTSSTTPRKSVTNTTAAVGPAPAAASAE